MDSLSGPVISGDMEDGSINKGMVAKVFVDSGLYQASKIIGVEYIDYPSKESEIGLVLEFDDNESKEIFFELCQIDDVIEVDNAT
jgi:hypothetical protein